MRPGLASWSLWRMPTQSPGRCGSSSPGCRGPGSGRRGAAWPRMPLWHRVAVWPLPRLLIFSDREKSPAHAGLLYSFSKSLTAPLPVVTTTPVAAAPATTAPAPVPATAPVAATPTPATAAPVAAAPAYFFGREAIDLGARCNSGLSIRVGGQLRVIREGCRHQRRGLRTRCERDTARGQSKGEFQKVAALHHISSSVCCLREREFRGPEMNAR
jgi:hypothetical protein